MDFRIGAATQHNPGRQVASDLIKVCICQSGDHVNDWVPGVHRGPPGEPVPNEVIRVWQVDKLSYNQTATLARKRTPVASAAANIADTVFRERPAFAATVIGRGSVSDARRP